MNFNIKYPEALTSPAIRFEPGPSPVMGGMEASGRVFPCYVCGKRTQWVAVDLDPECPEPHICSDECYKIFTTPVIYEPIPTSEKEVEFQRAVDTVSSIFSALQIPAEEMP